MKNRENPLKMRKTTENREKSTTIERNTKLTEQWNLITLYYNKVELNTPVLGLVTHLSISTYSCFVKYMESPAITIY